MVSLTSDSLHEKVNKLRQEFLITQLHPIGTMDEFNFEGQAPREINNNELDHEDHELINFSIAPYDGDHVSFKNVITRCLCNLIFSQLRSVKTLKDVLRIGERKKFATDSSNGRTLADFSEFCCAIRTVAKLNLHQRGSSCIKIGNKCKKILS